MIQTEFHVDQLFEGLALGRFFFHKDEVRRSLEPILKEVYNIGYDRGAADNANNLTSIEEEVQPQGSITANVEVITHEDVKEEVQCEQSSPEQPALSVDTSSES